MKKVLSLILILSILFSIATSASAAIPEIMSPNYENARTASVALSIDDSGNSTITLYCSATSSATAIDIVVYLERRIPGGWIRVNIDTGTNTWTFNTSNRLFIDTITYRILTYGEYRVTAEYTFYGQTTDEVVVCQDIGTYPN